jgi:probable HAF family extracellular repeat protein
VGYLRSSAVVVAIVVAGLTRVAGQGAPVFSSIDFPGAVLTNAQGINAGGEVVGFYTDTAGKTHGFLMSGGQYRSVDYPGAKSTQLRGIGPSGDVVGAYQRQDESGAVPIHGFLLTGHGDFYPIDFPGHQNTIAQRILPNGTILGCYHDTDTMETMHGMITNRAGINGFDMGMSMHNGATPDGKRIVGLWSDAGNHGHGYLLEHDNFAPFDVPDSLSTAAWDISARLEIVGVYTDSNRKVHGFLVDADWQFTTIDFPGATVTRTLGINSRGDVVGAYVSGGITHGYIGRRTDE